MVRKTVVQSQVESYQKLKKMILDAALLNTQHYMVRIKGKVEQSIEWSSNLPNISNEITIKRDPSDNPRLRSPSLYK